MASLGDALHRLDVAGAEVGRAWSLRDAAAGPVRVRIDSLRSRSRSRSVVEDRAVEGEAVAAVLASPWVLGEDPGADQRLNVPLRGGDGASGDGGPLLRGEVSLEAVELAVEDAPGAIGADVAATPLPELGLAQHARAGVRRRVDRTGKATEEPDKPVGDVQPSARGTSTFAASQRSSGHPLCSQRYTFASHSDANVARFASPRRIATGCHVGWTFAWAPLNGVH